MMLCAPMLLDRRQLARRCGACAHTLREPSRIRPDTFDYSDLIWSCSAQGFTKPQSPSVFVGPLSRVQAFRCGVLSCGPNRFAERNRPDSQKPVYSLED